MTTISTYSALGTAAPAAANAEKAKLEKTAKAFEAIFLRQMMATMRSATLSDDDVFGSSATSQFRELGDARTADTLSEKGAFGIADLLLKQLDKAHSAAAPAAEGGETQA